MLLSNSDFNPIFTVTQPKYECLDYTEADQTENDDELDESALCANAGGIFTNGDNAAYPGCDCSCCKGMVYCKDR